MDTVLIVPKRFKDTRGFFSELYRKDKYLESGVDVEFVQDNHSISQLVGTLRGLHFQSPPNAQAKLVRCGRGAIFDVAVDIRNGSPYFGKWIGHELTAENGAQLFVPVGFAHGFVTLEPESEIIYKCSDYFAPESEGSVVWNDPNIGIDWPITGEPNLSAKDLKAPMLTEFESPFIYGVNS